MREAEDIIRDVKDRFNAYISSSSSIKKLTDAVESGAASLIDADEFACELARCYNQALHDVVGDMSIEEYASIVEHVLPSGFHSMGSLSGAYTEHVINDQLRNAGYGLKAVPAPYSSYKEREVLSEILKRIETSGSVSEVEKTASKQVESFAQKAVMDTMSKNAREESNAGVVVKVTRIYDGVGVHDREDECKWCLRRCCTDKPYSEAKKMGTFERHPGCHCEIFYTTGKRTFRQTDWTRNQWTDAQDRDILERRKSYGLDRERITPKQREAEATVQSLINKINGTDNQSIREWYVASVSMIPQMVDTSQDIETQARQAYALRNRFKREARIAMSDRETADRLEKDKPVKGFDELLFDKMRRKHLTKEQAIEDILRTASKTNPDVNKEFGIGD